MSQIILSALFAVSVAMGAAETSSVTAVRDSYPHLSPDGRALVFHSNRAGSQGIWVADADGSNPRLLYDGGAAGEAPGTPVWSSEGRLIAFAMRPADATLESESDIYVMNPDGSNVRRLTETPGDDSHPHWSNSGRIYFNSARGTADLNARWGRQWIDIYSMAADGSDVRRHTNCRNLCTYPVPSPDEKFVAHRRITETLGQNWDLSPGTRNSDVFVSPIDGREGINVSNSPAYDGWPSWSPDGKWVVFASNRDRIASTGQIYAVRPDGTDLQPLTRGSWSRAQPSFSPDGKLLLVYESFETADFEVGHIASFTLSMPE